jgi:hypothetical protein
MSYEEEDTCHMTHNRRNTNVPMPRIAEESTCHNPRTRRLHSRLPLSPPNLLVHSQRKVRVRAIFSRRDFFFFSFFPLFPRSWRVSVFALRAALCLWEYVSSLVGLF